MPHDTPSVLILEPNPLQCNLIKMTLDRYRMTTIVCGKPDGLRQKLLECAPDVLLIDTSLPGQNGLDLIDELRSGNFLQRTRIFFISAMGYPEIVEKAALLGASGFLVKPLDLDALASRILNSLNRSIELSM